MAATLNQVRADTKVLRDQLVVTQLLAAAEHKTKVADHAIAHDIVLHSLAWFSLLTNSINLLINGINLLINCIIRHRLINAWMDGPDRLWDHLDSLRYHPSRVQRWESVC